MLVYVGLIMLLALSPGFLAFHELETAGSTAGSEEEFLLYHSGGGVE